ncbi:MAG: hypothetical protein D3908_03940, partial [Candidatus Electrothrix sp. AUS4]|nr:hypothetical protein [Candidatus Electrothrix sp. AUS4]
EKSPQSLLSFDQIDAAEGKASRWVRMAQPYAGADYGMHFPLHKGTEVLLTFVDGDPDRPIIAGAVPNPETGSPVTGGNQTQSMIRSGGGNQLHMGDQQGEEEFYFYAKKDMNTTVENDRTTTVNSGNDKLTVQSGTQSVIVQGDRSLTVQAGSRSVSVSGGDYSTTASAAVKVYGQGAGVSVTGNGGPGVKITGNPNFKAKGASKASIMSPLVEIGNSVIEIKGSSIELSAGGSTIKIDGSGVTVSTGGMITQTASIIKHNS